MQARTSPPTWRPLTCQGERALLSPWALTSLLEILTSSRDPACPHLVPARVIACSTYGFDPLELGKDSSSLKRFQVCIRAMAFGHLSQGGQSAFFPWGLLLGTATVYTHIHG